jgi:DNA-directed RNA polymerase beta subunit
MGDNQLTDIIEEDQILTEISISGLRPATVSRNAMRIDRPTVFITFPDTNLNIWNVIYQTGMLLSNCQAIIAPSKRITIGRKPFNAKIHQLDLKKNLLKAESPGRKLRVITTLPLNLRNKKTKLTSEKPKTGFYYYDASIYSHALKYLESRFSGKILARMVFGELSNLYQSIKAALPTTNIELLFLIKNREGNLANILQSLYIYIPEKDFAELKLFDNFGLVSNTDNVIIPVAHKKRGKPVINRRGIKKIDNYMEAEDIAKIATKETAIEDSPVPEVPTDFVSKMISDLKTSNLESTVTPNGDVNIGIDSKAISRLLKKHKINDPDIAINVKTAIDAYLKEKGDKLTTTEAETILLKALNYTIHGTDNVPEEYLAKPQRLFSKLKEIKTHRYPLNFPKQQRMINPETVIDISHTTGQHRQRFEFEQTIHENVRKLFKSIEDVKDHPIKVKKIEHAVDDNDQDRFINYKVTLQNLTGENKKQYVVELRVPAPVNDKYFKIHGSSYIIASQQFMKPITKTDKNDVRILSNYAIIRVGIKNLKFNPSDVDEIIDNYIGVRYPNIIKKKDQDSITFSDNSVLFFTGDIVYTDKDKLVRVNSDSAKLMDQNGEEIKYGRSEFMYEILLQKIQTVNPEDNMYRTQKSIPYIYVYMSGIYFPLIIYLWTQKGLLSALNDLGINYEITQTNKLTGGYVFIPITSSYVAIKPKSTREKLIVNGLLKNRIKKPIDDVDDPEQIFEHISNNYGSSAIMSIHNMTENMIDPVTKELLEFENLPTSLPQLISGYVLDLLLNNKADTLADLKIYRSRMSEMVLQSMYKQIKAAHNEYKNRVNFGEEDAKLWLDSEFIIRDMITDAGVLQHTEPVSPVDEIMLSSRVIKSGKGGVRSKNMFKVEQRNLHHSQYGIISANSTPESTNVGIVNRHTLTPTIINKYGSYGAKDITNVSGWNTLAIEEALVPFQNQMDSDRMVMAATHQGQVTPIEDAEAPLIGTGAEFIVPQLASSRFCHNAKMGGKVVSVDKDKTITVKYKNGDTETLDIIPRMSRTKMGAYISLQMNTLSEGETFKKNQLIAWTKNFTKDSKYASGKNVFLAVMNPMGFGHEDAYCISQEFSESARRDMVKEVGCIIPPEMKILNMETKIGKKVDKDDVLIEFVYEENLDDYLEINNMMDEGDEEVLSSFGSGENSIKLLAFDGEIIDIKIYINNKNSIDPQVVSFHKKLVADKKKTIGLIAKTAKSDYDKFKSIDNIDSSFFKTSGHKYKQNEFQGARIVYFIKEQKPLIEGDKIASRYGAKGVVGKVFEKTPYGEITPRIDVFISPSGVFSRKNLAMIKELYLGKVIYFLNEKVKEMANNPKNKSATIVRLLLDIYKLLASDKIYKDFSKNIKTFTDAKLRRLFKDENFTFTFIVEPFTDVPFKNIKTAAEHLGIKLDEKVYLPELDSWTEVEVPVGVIYYNALEQFSEIYANVRSTGMYQGLTRQPAKGKAKQGGQSVGQLDMQALLTYNIPSVINELFTLRSDDHRSKRLVNNEIITNGEANIPTTSGRGGTSQILDVYITTLGLEIV